MRYRLTGIVGEQPVSILLAEGCNLVGSESGCAVELAESTVSRQHAEVSVSGDRVEVRDLSSKNGTFVGQRKVSARRIYPGMSVSFGRVRLSLEAVSQRDVDLGLRFPEGSRTSRGAGLGAEPGSTVGLRPVELFVADALGKLLELVEAGADEAELAQAGATALYNALPATRVTVTTKDAVPAVVYSAEHEEAPAVGAAARVEAPSGSLLLSVELPNAEMVQPYQPVVEAVAALIRLAGRRVASSPTDRHDVREALAPPLPQPESVAASIQRIYREAARVAQGTVGVLICGESGTGKEVLSRYLHAASERAQKSFVALNCAALPNDLLEAELFGIERGVATGVDSRSGKFELAHGGTLFLDEIGDMSQTTQAKILRVLQEKEVFRLGGNRAYPADCRIIAATNRDLGELLDEGRFRKDLYYRIATWVVELPALRHRRQDIPNLAAYFLKRETAQRGVRVRGISSGALAALASYHWPGNIRQLSNEMARAALFLDDGQALEATQLSAEILAPPSEGQQGTLEERVARYERLEIVKALQRCGGVATAAAKELGIGRSTLYRRMKALSIENQEG